MNRYRTSTTSRARSFASRLRQPYPNSGPAILLALLLPGYHAILILLPDRPRYMPALAVDGAIQVEPAWMLAYGSIWVFAFLPVFIIRQHDLMRRAMLAFLLVMLVAYGGFLTYPTVLPRPASVGDGFFAWALQRNYDLDPPYNCFPSLHVAWAFVAALTCHRVHRGVGVVALLWATIIGVSTLYTKQHYALDVLAGIAIAGVAYLMLLRGYPREAIPRADQRRAPNRALRAVWLYVAVVAFLWVGYHLTVVR